MPAQPIRGAIAVLPLLLTLVPCASGQTQSPPPATQDVVYKIHDDPNDPNSAIALTVKLFLTSEDYDRNWVGWEITEARFRQPNGGEPDRIWIESDPNVPSQDGLWWIEHADRSDPQLSEFDDPPHLVGLAAAENPNNDDLEYDFQGASYTPPPGGPPWDPTGALGFEFTIDGQSTPFLDETDEPVEIGDEDDPPA